LRSLPGQLSLFGIAFAGAVVLAVAAVCLRGRIFEPFIREKYPAVDEALEARLCRLACDALDDEEAREELRRLEKQREALYGAWIERPDLDPSGRFARLFGGVHSPWLLARLEQTLVAGNVAQRRRAQTWLKYLPEEMAGEARALAEFARERALHRREDDLVQELDAVLEQLSPPRGVP
jgi:hypothetical protein